MQTTFRALVDGVDEFIGIDHIAVSSGYAYIAEADAGLRVVSVTDPSNPIEVGSYDTPGSARGVVARRNFSLDSAVRQECCARAVMRSVSRYGVNGWEQNSSRVFRTG